MKHAELTDNRWMKVVYYLFLRKETKKGIVKI